MITTDEGLSAEDMRQLAHLRWSIENRTFRRLSHLVESKRRVTKDTHVRETLLGLWFIGLNLFGLFLAPIRMGRLNPAFKPVEKTWKWFCELFKRATAGPRSPSRHCEDSLPTWDGAWYSWREQTLSWPVRMAATASAAA